MSEKIKVTHADSKTSLDPVDFTNINKIIRQKRVNVSNKNAIKGFFKKLFLIILVLWLLFTFIFGFFVVYNDDMFPKMVPSDLLMYYRLDRDFYVGDVVVVGKNDADYALRIVASGGDEVDISDEGQLIINGSYQAETNIFYPTREYDETTIDIKFPMKLKENEVFALGDMRKGAKDSRYFGPVERDEIKGKVFALYRRSKF
ncbi:signal peptidase I [Anaerococcus sp. Marseille-Q5996]|uniref:signal peptidase I n=1 Tax=Anaerococcus sp. Marseille-Q5996 TaxID=2972769 RepID=UPI0021C91B83|nr:signal peptidase I [Anaerococcus sp. Marseille-Q5996]